MKVIYPRKKRVTAICSVICTNDIILRCHYVTCSKYVSPMFFLGLSELSRRKNKRR
jgi:hypothetical protein